ncbi:hypothetical protein [Paenibacillus polymyxa]|uniref:hypothetical protein n=1 Tax=Paenibacillus polymyxa TaxID=1406 RepID=UPI0003D2BAFC|nr:hypothetical protein [Paenibacillus polymyxa]AIW40947.1 hypothetical protein X809_33625 [Paenibacillus polymyxa CR1]
MKKSYNLYLVLSLSFILIIFISLVIGIRPEIIFGYSIATLIFAIIDFVNVLQDGKDKMKLLKKEDMNNTLDNYIGAIDSIVGDAMENIQDGKRELVNTRKKFYGKLLAQQPLFNLKKRNVKKAMKPAEDISEISKDIQMSNDFLSNITKDLKSLDPSNNGRRSNSIEWLFSLVGLLLVLVSPFIPEKAYVLVFGEQYNSVGTYLVLLSLSLIFLTSFFRHRYTERVLELQKIQYSAMLSQFERVKFQMEFGMKDLNNALQESSEEFG